MGKRKQEEKEEEREKEERGLREEDETVKVATDGPDQTPGRHKHGQQENEEEKLGTLMSSYHSSFFFFNSSIQNRTSSLPLQSSLSSVLPQPY